MLILNNFHSYSSSLSEARQDEPCSLVSPVSCVRPFKSFPNKYRIAPQYNLAACLIEKSMSTMTAAIMCLLYDPQAFHQANRSLHTEMYHNRFCKNKNELNTLHVYQKRNPQSKLLIIVREPIDRFLSGFVDKCIRESKQKPKRCYGCGKNLTCFMHKQYSRMMNYASGSMNGISFEDVHFNPQNWHCNFREGSKQHVVIRYGSSGAENLLMIEQLSQLLQSVSVEPQVIKEIRQNLTVTRTEHSTSTLDDRQMVEKQLRSDPHLMDLLVRMFYYDFILFGYPLPTMANKV